MKNLNMYFETLKKLIHIVQYLKKINIFIEIVACVNDDTKIDSRQGKAKVFINF